MEEHNVIEWTDETGKICSYEDWNIPDDVVANVAILYVYSV